MTSVRLNDYNTASGFGESANVDDTDDLDNDDDLDSFLDD